MRYFCFPVKNLGSNIQSIVTNKCKTMISISRIPPSWMKEILTCVTLWGASFVDIFIVQIHSENDYQIQ